MSILVESLVHDGEHLCLDRRSPVARAALMKKGLPDAQIDRLWGGYGSGLPCDACSRMIDQDEIEYELEYRQGEQRVTLLLHVECWRSAADGE